MYRHARWLCTAMVISSSRVCRSPSSPRREPPSTTRPLISCSPRYTAYLLSVLVHSRDVITSVNTEWHADVDTDMICWNCLPDSVDFFYKGIRIRPSSSHVCGSTVVVLETWVFVSRLVLQSLGLDLGLGRLAVHFGHKIGVCLPVLYVDCWIIEWWSVISWSVDHHSHGCTSVYYVSNDFFQPISYGVVLFVFRLTSLVSM